MPAMKTLVSLAFIAPLALACGGSAKKAPDGPLPTDVPREVTCCIAVDDAGNAAHSVVSVEECPEENRNPVDACDIGPGDAEPVD
jgi:hypothetical protein